MSHGGRAGGKALPRWTRRFEGKGSGPSKMQIQRGTICYVVHSVCAPDEKLKHWTRGVCFTRKREVRRRRIGRRSIYFLFAKKSVENWREQTKKQWVTIIPPPKSQDDEGREKGRSGQVFVRLIKGYPFIPNFAVLENFSAAKWGFIIAAGSAPLSFLPSPQQAGPKWRAEVA